MPISAHKHGTRLPGEWAWHAGPTVGVAGSQGRRSGRTHATYLARPGRRRSRQARRGRSSACQLRGYSLSVHRAAAKPRGASQQREHAPSVRRRNRWPPTHSEARVAWPSQPSWERGGTRGQTEEAGAASSTAVWGPVRLGQAEYHASISQQWLHCLSHDLFNKSPRVKA